MDEPNEAPLSRPLEIRRKMAFSKEIREQALRMTHSSTLQGRENLIDINEYNDLTPEFRAFTMAQNDLVTQDPEMEQLKKDAVTLSNKKVNVLILGESGTGKELVAQILHGQKPKDTLVTINCAGIPGELFESTLFGHRKGSFTGAINDAVGRIELAHGGGTVFLDEIGDLPMPQQAKLLRTIENGEYTRVGDSVSRKIDCRWIAATNKDIKAAMRQTPQAFRLDLYYRFDINLRTIPLRDRLADIPLIANTICHRNGWRPLTEDELAQAIYQEGNVRELKAYITHCIMLDRPPKTII